MSLPSHSLLVLHLLLFDSTGSLDFLRMFKNCVHELAKQALHVALTSGKQTLQEGNVPAVGRQHERNVGKVLDYVDWEGCESRKYIGIRNCLFNVP